MKARIWRDLLLLVLFFGTIWGGFSLYNYNLKSNPLALSKENEEKLSEFVNENLMQDLEIIDNPRLDSCIQIIIDRLTDHMDTVSYDYQIAIIESSEINAFTSLNGQLYVYTGLLKILEKPEELAIILAHELGHAEGRHVIEKMVKTVGLETLFAIASGGDPVLIAELAKLSVSNSFDRKNEEEADDFAIDLAIKSGINPRRLGQFFLKLKLEQEDYLLDLELLRTHPMDNDRIQKSAETELPEGFEEDPIDLDWSFVIGELRSKTTEE